MRVWSGTFIFSGISKLNAIFITGDRGKWANQPF